MPHILKNANLEIHIDLPVEGYNFSRFDWTGKITQIKFQGIPVTTVEDTEVSNLNHYGRGLYNEFGMDAPPGFTEAQLGSWFIKIGIGALKKYKSNYLFSDPYQVEPSKFKIGQFNNRLVIEAASKTKDGYGYLLKKELILKDDQFILDYQLKNTGLKVILTEEYVHNFLAVNHDLIGSEYILKFPFLLEPEYFKETVNPERIVVFDESEIRFLGTPEEQFFFSDLSGNKEVEANWKLEHIKSGISVSETASFTSDKINLWGWKHVISPELFYRIEIAPGESTAWSRTYQFDIV